MDMRANAAGADSVEGKPEDKEPIDYESLGKLMRRVRKEHGLTQDQVVNIQGLNLDRSVYAKYESGKVRPSEEFIKRFAEHFHVKLDEMLKKVSIAIPDTCALLKNKRLLEMLLNDYDQVIIPGTVLSELSYRKNHGQSSGEQRVAWQMMANIDYYSEEYKDRFRIVSNDRFKVAPSTRKIENDLKVIELAKSLRSEKIANVIIVTDDVDLTTQYEDAVQIDDYVAKRSKTVDYDAIMDLDKEFKHLEYYRKIAEKLDLNAYLPDGMTLLISCIRCNTKDSGNWRFGRPITEQDQEKKLRFLLENGASPNLNDNGRYCLSPLAHCVQTRNFQAFRTLLEYGCDFNKGSRDERTYSHMKIGKLNEGNTPLMIACWQGLKMFAEQLCALPGISLNQQDSNGYTALIKCAVQRYNRKKAGKPYAVQEELYRYLISKGADQLIRDRNNETAQDWWEKGEQLDEEA